MTLQNGYEIKTTFIQDFRIAEPFGVAAIKDTFKRAMKEWKTNIQYITELAIATNTLCWLHYDAGNTELSELYSDLYYQVQDYVYEGNHFSQAELDYYFQVTD